MAALLHDLGKPECFRINANGVAHMKGHPEAGRRIAERLLTGLKYPKKFTDEVCRLVAFHDIYTPPEVPAVHKVLCQVGPGLYEKLKVLQRADIMAHSELGKKRLEKLEYMTKIAEELNLSGAVYAAKDLEITGDDLISMGCPKGPEVGEILDALFEKYIAGEITNNRDLLIKSAKEMIS
jgi:tRNA nucleotidyltransferase (CCA-adding enzyme)